MSEGEGWMEVKRDEVGGGVRWELIGREQETKEGVVKELLPTFGAKTVAESAGVHRLAKASGFSNMFS